MKSQFLNHSILAVWFACNPAGNYAHCSDHVVVVREPKDATVSRVKSAASAVGPESGSPSPPVGSDDMPSFDEWKLKEQEKTKISEGLSLTCVQSCTAVVRYGT